MTGAKRQDTLLIQFAKWPEAGRVKTRLAVALGEQGALQAHIRLTQTVLQNLLGSGLAVEFWWDRPVNTPLPEAVPILEQLAQADVRQRHQQGANLGARMTHALTTALARFQRVMIVGSDCPSVDADYLLRGLEALKSHDLVLGPSEDGGYVMIGASRTEPGMLDDIAWGTPEVLAQTCRQFKKTGLRYTLLEPRWDVDEPEDWCRFLAR